MELKELKNGKYNLIKRTLKFDSNVGEIVIDPKEALEIVFTIFDAFDMDYMTVYELENRILGLDDIKRRTEEDGWF